MNTFKNIKLVNNSWKRIRTRIRNLKELGLPEWLAIKWGLTRRGGWHVVQRRSPHEYLKKLIMAMNKALS